MATFSKFRLDEVWRTDWFAGLCIVFATLILHVTTDFDGALERRLYDGVLSSSARQPSDQLAVIAIDDQSIAELGRWPWPRDIHARLIDQLAAAKARTVVDSSYFFGPEQDRGLPYIRQMREALAVAPDAAAGNGPVSPQLSALLSQAEVALDTDRVLADSLQKAGNVLISSLYAMGQAQGQTQSPAPSEALPAFALRDTLADVAGYSIPAQRGQQPIALLGEAAAAVGHWSPLPDVDGTVRHVPLLLSSGGRAMPSLALLAAGNSLNLKVAELHVAPGESLTWGPLRVPTDAHAQMLPQFYRGHEGQPAIREDAFSEVLSGKIPASRYADKIVVIGATAAGVGAPWKVPGHPEQSAAQTLAQVISSILRGHAMVQPHWGEWLAAAASLLTAACVVLVLPRLSAAGIVAMTAALLLLLLGGEWGLLALSGLWLPLVLPASVLLLGTLGVSGKRLLRSKAAVLQPGQESSQTLRQMGLALQSQGQLDMAWDRFRRVPLDAVVMGDLNRLALEFERKNQFTQAEAIFAHMATFDQANKDMASRQQPAVHQAAETTPPAHPGASLVVPEADSFGPPMLGRYQIDKELGKGAMGVVYLGKDPKIGRVVAIKTMALSREFAGNDLADARERFFREAETAGRLQHQNIVTIFDAGEAHDLAYIAMEFLKGRDLLAYCKPGQTLPVATVLSIVARVAEALGYAHHHHVVHRDIKPANIMYALESDTVKVTDFGIARITDASKTKTSMVLGTPNYMSPEQLTGLKVDGRSDLYSLGVMLFQLLTGALPFRGDSMAELMSRIANDEAVDIRSLRADLPPALSTIVARAMCKKPEQRYQTGEQFAADLRAVMVLAPSAKAAVEAELDAMQSAQRDMQTMPDFEPTQPSMYATLPVQRRAGTDLDI